MGRGGGSGGGSHGGFSSGGSRGFSSHRSSGSSSHRGGGSSSSWGSYSGSRGRSGYGGYGGLYGSRPYMPHTGRRTTVFMSSGRSGAPSGRGRGTETGQQGGPASLRQEGGGRKPPYKLLAIIAAIALAACLVLGILAASAKEPRPREKLGDSACISSDTWIDDRLGWLADTGQVTDAMRYFYGKTGVQPYLLICDNLDGKGGEITDDEAEEYLKALYDSLYEDEGHMIYAFMEYADSQYITWIYTGRAADAVMDSDARGLFLGNADRYYTDSSLTDEGYFAKTFRKSADQVMKGGDSAKGPLTACAMTAGIIAALAACAAVWLAVKESKMKEREQLKGFLDTPVGQSPEADELEKKYQ